MRKNFYLRLALGNIRKNGKFYLPFLLTCIAAAAMFFNMCSIYTNETLTSRQDAQMILGLGVIVIALFSAIFLFYTNSFLIKRRKKELALYNIFGMEKRHIGRMLVWEKVVTAVISIGGGLLTGILFDRLMFLILLKTPSPGTGKVSSELPSGPDDSGAFHRDFSAYPHHGYRPDSAIEAGGTAAGRVGRRTGAEEQKDSGGRRRGVFSRGLRSGSGFQGDLCVFNVFRSG